MLVGESAEKTHANAQRTPTHQRNFVLICAIRGFFQRSHRQNLWFILFRSHTDSPIQADDFAVEHGVFNDVLGQGGIFVRAAQA